MTKTRAPCTWELALTKVAGQIGWDEVARIAAQAERTVRNWSDPDTGPAAGASITLDLALALDVAFRVGGGDGAPMLQCHAVRVEADTITASPDLARLQALVAHSARESGEATAASIVAASLGAGERELASAELELEESIAAQTSALVMIRCMRRGEGVPEVTPPARIADATG